MKRYYLITILTVMSLGNVLSAQSNEIEGNFKYKLDSYLSKGVNNGFSGTVLVARRGKVLLSKGFGLANKENQTLNNTTTVFDIGSVTKQFTGAAILKLVQLNKLKVSDSLKKFFKNVPDDKKDITIHQLLTHSAGFIDVIGEGDFDHIPTHAFFEELFATELIYTPGTKYRYSNSGYSILARIIELVSGKEYEVFLNEHLFEPAGMHETGYLLPKWGNNVFAIGYRDNVLSIGSMAKRYLNEGEISWVLKGNGGINSTQEDMFKWYKALKENKILSKSLTKKLTLPYVAEDEEASSHYAYGWAIMKTSRGTKMITHDGSNGVFMYDFRWFPKEDVVILFATNAYTPALRGITRNIEKMLFDSSYTPEEIKKDLTTELLEYTQNYDDRIDSLSYNLKHKFDKKIKYSFYLNRLGGIYLRKNNLRKAIAAFELNVELFPEDGNLWDSLGDAYLANNQSKKAIKSFSKALELKPKDYCYWCENSSEKLKQLQHKE